MKIMIIQQFEHIMKEIHKLLVILVLVGAVNCVDSVTNPGKDLTSYFTLAPAVTYTLNFSMSSTIISGSVFQLLFSNKFNIDNTSLSNCKASLSNSIALTTSSCNVLYSSLTGKYTLTYDSVFPTTQLYSFLSLQFVIKNPWANITEQIDVYVTQLPSTTKASGSVYIDYQASVMTACTMTSSTTTTGQSSTHTISMLPSREILADTYLSITMPIWYSISSISSLSSGSLVCTGVQNTDTSSLSCSLTPIISDQSITINAIITSTKNISSPIIINLTSLRNPWSLAPFGSITYQLMNTGSFVSQRCTGTYLTVSAPNTFSNITFTLTNLAISSNSTGVRIRMTVRNPFPKDNTQVRVRFPSEVKLSYTTINTVLLAASNSTQMLFSPFPNNTAIGGLVTVGTFTVTNPPSTKPFSITFTSQIIINGTNYKMDQSTLTYNANPGSITLMQITGSNLFINKKSTYTIQFRITNKLVVGSTIILKFPSTLTLSLLDNCTSNVTATCTVTSTSNITLTVTTDLLSATGIKLIANNVLNGPDTQATASIEIYTYYLGGSFDTLVDTVSTGLSVTLIANPITNTTITPTSKQTFVTTSYLFNIILVDPITQGGFIRINFPTTVTLISPAILSASFSTTTCSLNQTVAQRLDIIGCFSSSSMTNLTLSLNLSGIRNPNSFQPTSTFVFQTYSSSSLLINYINSGLTVTMTTATLVQSLSIQPTDYTVHATNLYTIILTHTITNHLLNDFFILTLPFTVTFTSSPVCSGVSGVASVSCFSFNNNTALNLSYTGTIASQTLRITIANIINYDVGDTPITFLLQVYNSNGFMMEKTAGIAVTYVQGAITSFSVNNDANIALNELSNISITFSTPFALNSLLNSSLTGLTITIPQEFTIGSSCSSSTLSVCSRFSSTQYKVTSIGNTINNVVITMSNILLPTYSPTSSSFQLQYTYSDANVTVQTAGITVSIFCTTPCQRCNVTPDKCLSCLPAPNNQTLYDPIDLKCVAVCPDGKYPNITNTTRECKLCISPCSICTTSLDCTKCVNNTWLFESRCMSPCPSTYFNDSTGACLPCQPPCKTCQTLLQCQSCVNNTYLTNSTCVNSSSCPSGTYANATTLVCQTCLNPCQFCSNTFNNCTKCINNTWLSFGSCLGTCPNNFYNDSSGVCLSCQPPCVTCSTINLCKSCINNTFLTNSSCVNETTCPSGTYANTTTLVCELCQIQCQTCSKASDNCTSCSNTSFIFNNTCLVSCPNGTFSNERICTFCVNPCLTCSSLTFCNSCITDFLYNGTCIPSTDCPIGTYANLTTKKCMTCPSECTQCSNSLNCTFCSTPIYFFFNYSCVSTCPGGTYKNGIVCQSCVNPCVNCENSSNTCLSCTVGLFLYLNTCVVNCPVKFFKDILVCSTCKNVCQTCTNSSMCTTCPFGLFLDSFNNCISNCPNGYYNNIGNNTCTSCTTPCSSCSMGPLNCTACQTPKVQFGNICLDQCPNQYFDVNGSCKTCPNCLNCFDSTTCLACKPSFFYYNGACSTTCPSIAPIEDVTTSKCITCDAKCLTCSITTRNCTSCYNGQYFIKNDCVKDCPSGYIASVSTSTCTEAKLGGILFVPCSAAVFVSSAIVIYSFCIYGASTSAITTMASVVGFFQYISWYFLILFISVDQTLSSTIKNISIYVGLAVIATNLVLGIIYIVYIYQAFNSDRLFLDWKDHDSSCRHAYRVMNCFGTLNFRTFRLLYSGLFDKIYFKLFFANYESFFSLTNKLSIISLVIFTLPMVGISALMLYVKQTYEQSLYSSIDTIFLGSLSCIFVIIDSHKSKEYFQKLRKELPYGKYNEMNMDSMLDVMSQGNQQRKKARMSQGNQQRKKALTDMSEDEQEKIFKKISFLPNLNKFGHLNVIQKEKQDSIKSLPELQQLSNHQQLDPKLFQNKPNHKSEFSDAVVNQIFFQDEIQILRLEEQRQKMKEEEERLKRQQLQRQQIKRKRLEFEQYERLRKEEEERQRLLRKLQDEQEQVNLQFPDIAVIEKHQGKNNNKGRTSPLKYLAKFGKTDEKQIDEKALKKLKDISIKNGLDSDFMVNTFGVQKHNNIELLNSVIDKHYGVNRESVKKMFSQNNNPEILQQLFGKNSDVDIDKLKGIMNNKDAQKMIEMVADNQKGILSTEMAKQLLSKDSKYNPEFINNLLGDNSQMSRQKLQTILKDGKGKGKDSPLKALQKIGGQNLQNTEILKNMLGENSNLDAQNFTKVVNQLSAKSIENIFKNKSQNSQIITKKILNNKKIPLKQLATILEDEEMIQDLAKALISDNENVQNNLINLFKNADQINHQHLGELLRDPILVQKLLGNPIDPEFLTQILKKGSNTDLSLLKEVLKDMKNQDIQQIFQFNPQKNIDYKALATLFQKNNKTDPQLVKKMMVPQIIGDIYSKGNNQPKRLLKLVEKGANFDKQVLLSIYGKNNNHFLNGKNQQNINEMIDTDRKDDYRSEKGQKNPFNNIAKNIKNMSRTDGGMMGFLSPIRVNNRIGIDQARQTQWHQNQIIPKRRRLEGARQTQWHQNQEHPEQIHQQEDEDEGEEIIDDQINKKRRKKSKIKKKQYSDIRLKAEEIYLQRIEAPHQANVRKAQIRKKKQKVSVNNQVMDEDNDFIDLDF